jgi:hypothetical protein
MARIIAVRTIVPLLALVVCMSPALAGPILEASDVTYDADTGLYTYTYSLNRQGKYFIDGFEVLAVRGADGPGLAPVAQTAPLGWMFWSGYSGLDFSAWGFAPLPAGFYWGWGIPFRTHPPDVPDPLRFSFTTAAAPAPVSGASYLIWNGVVDAEPPFPAEIGSVSAPNLSIAPEPSALVLAGAAAVGWSWSRWRSRKRSPAAQAAGPDSPR